MVEPWEGKLGDVRRARGGGAVSGGRGPQKGSLPKRGEERDLTARHLSPPPGGPQAALSLCSPPPAPLPSRRTIIGTRRLVLTRRKTSQAEAAHEAASSTAAPTAPPTGETEGGTRAASAMRCRRSSPSSPKVSGSSPCGCSAGRSSDHSADIAGCWEKVPGMEGRRRGGLEKSQGGLRCNFVRCVCMCVCVC